MFDTQQIRHTKKLNKLLERYDVCLRRHNTPVVHVVTGRTTDCDPLTFAVFEAAIKSVYLSNALHPDWAKCCKAGHHRHYLALARRNQFQLPDPTNVRLQDRDDTMRQAAVDYHYCVSLISKAGLYFALLD